MDWVNNICQSQWVTAVVIQQANQNSEFRNVAAVHGLPRHFKTASSVCSHPRPSSTPPMSSEFVPEEDITLDTPLGSLQPEFVDLLEEHAFPSCQVLHLSSPVRALLLVPGAGRGRVLRCRACPRVGEKVASLLYGASMAARARTLLAWLDDRGCHAPHPHPRARHRWSVPQAYRWMSGWRWPPFCPSVTWNSEG